MKLKVDLDYKINEDFTVFGKFGNVEYKDENSQRITAGVNSSLWKFKFQKFTWLCR